MKSRHTGLVLPIASQGKKAALLVASSQLKLQYLKPQLHFISPGSRDSAQRHTLATELYVLEMLSLLCPHWPKPQSRIPSVTLLFLHQPASLGKLLAPNPMAERSSQSFEPTAELAASAVAAGPAIKSALAVRPAYTPIHIDYAAVDKEYEGFCNKVITTSIFSDSNKPLNAS